MPSKLHFPKFIWLLLAFPYCAFAQADANPTEAVTATIKALFDGMRDADSTIVAKIFHPEARLMTAAQDAEGKVAVRQAPIEGFVSRIGQAEPGTLDEQVDYYEVRINGPLATVYTPYRFVYEGNFSHCGVNTFQLVETGDGSLPWQILQITDTRQREGCPDPSAEEESIATFLDAWHLAAAEADEDVFFGSMAPEGVYIGTDATERWLRDTFYNWAASYFERDAAWDFTPYDRHISFDATTGTGHWDELLDTWMGICRGSGVFRRSTNGSYEILHYHLSVTIPNDQIEAFMKLKPDELKKQR